MPKMKTIALAMTLAGALSAPALAGGEYSQYGDLRYPLVAVSGIEVTKGGWESYSGAYYAFNRDFDSDGVIVRAIGIAGAYDHSAFGASVDSDYWQGDVMIGYQWVRGGFDFSVMVGAEYQKHRGTIIDPGSIILLPPATVFRGSNDEFGFKIAADLESNWRSNSPIYTALAGSYSTAFDTYEALGRIGYNFGAFTFGPEVWALGDEAGDAQRVGGFLKFDREMGTTASVLSVSAGYQFGEDNPWAHYQDGAYATLQFRMAFGESRGAAPMK